MFRPLPPSTLFPYTTLFRSQLAPIGRPERPASAALRHLPLPAVHVRIRPDEDFRLPRLVRVVRQDRKSTRLNSSHANISYAVFCLKKKNNDNNNLIGSKRIP